MLILQGIKLTSVQLRKRYSAPSLTWILEIKHLDKMASPHR
jgi:hypothetical protein